MKPIIFAADLHLDCRNPDIMAGGEYLRETEARLMLDALLARAIEAGAGAIVIAGDVSHFRNPRAWAYVLFGDFLLRCKQEDIEVHIIRGNHDGDDLGRKEFCQAFGTRGFHYYRTPQVAQVCGRSVLMLPWAGRSTVAAKAGHTMTVAEQNAYMRDAFERIIQSYPAEVIVTHFTIAGVTFSTEAQPLLGDSSEFMLPLMAFHTPELKYVVSGHIHKAQVLHNGAVPIYYPGSTILCDFGQEREVPMVLLDDGDPRHVPLVYDHLRFVTVGLSFDPDIDASLEGAIVRFKGEVPSGDEGARFVAGRMQYIEEKQPAYIAKPVLTLRRHEARFTHTITAETTPADALTEYIGLVGGEYAERSEALALLHHGIEKEVSSETINA
ncbi:MAG: metallophosphoesterase family protein [Coriobacteriia bacterium]|nr:metallophosphoesterase family protein [Coriobacteriia bacterium]